MPSKTFLDSPSPRRFDNRGSWLFFLILSSVFFFLYWLTRINVHTELDDAMNYGSYLHENVLEHLFHGSHLIYLWVIVKLHSVYAAHLSAVNVYQFAQLVNSFFAAVNVGLVFLIIRRIGGIFFCSAAFLRSWFNL